MSTLRRVGQTERWVARFKRLDDDGRLLSYDPDDPTFEVTSPDGTVETYVYPTDAEVERTGEGVYRFALEYDAVLRWKVRAYSTSPLRSTEAKTRIVKAA